LETRGGRKEAVVRLRHGAHPRSLSRSVLWSVATGRKAYRCIPGSGRHSSGGVSAGTGASAARSYWENGRAAALAAGQAPPAVSVPVGFTVFPGEIFAAPRSWVEAVYPNLTYFNEVDRGGHFAAWEEPQLFSEEVRAAFRSLR
jgi:pimeloyl-ACP methyl ester carboxylesterase